MALKESKIFTVGTFYGDKKILALNYCYTSVNKAGVLYWRTRVWCYWRTGGAIKVRARIKKLIANGMVFMPNVKNSHAVSVADQMKLVDCGLLDHVQLLPFG